MKDEEGTMLGQQADAGVSPREGGRLPMRGDAGGEGIVITARLPTLTEPDPCLKPGSGWAGFQDRDLAMVTLRALRFASLSR